jgi:DNA-binding NarL/FixJ family response regulator
VNSKPRVGLTTWLVLLVLGAVHPLLLFAGATPLKISRDARTASTQGQVDTARALAVVGEAGTGTAAVTLASQLVLDVVLMDVNMPEMNGIDATRAIRASFPTMRVIGLSMFDRGDQQAAMQDAGAVAYVSKNAPAEELLAAIRGKR